MNWRQRLYQSFSLVTPVIFIQTLFYKFSAAPESVYIFSRVGMEPWGRYLTGSIELVSSILFFIPGWSWLGAALAINVMIGAIFSHLTLLGIDVQDDSGLLFGMALAVLMSSTVKLYQQRYRVPLVGALLKQSDQLAMSYDSGFKTNVGHRLPIIIILSFSALCAFGITEQIFFINQILSVHLPGATEISLARSSYFMTLLSVLITFLLTLVVVRIFEKPLHELISVCVQISKGDRSSRSHLPLNSELGILSTSLNKMLEEIQSKENQLQENGVNIQRLLRVVIHDVANPLTVVSALSKMALKKGNELDEKQFKDWTRVHNASRKIEAIITSTRDFEAIRSGVKKLELKKVSVMNCLESVIDTFQEKASSKGIKLTLENLTGVPHPEALADETLFVSSVVSNIVSNALKFSPENSAVEFLISDKTAKNICVTIVDHGVGLPQEMRQTFNRGGNVHSRTGTSGEQGTGFGLEIARSMMKSMDGDLAIESKTIEESAFGHGTRVSLLLKRPAA